MKQTKSQLFSLGEIVDKLGGVLVGDPSIRIDGVASPRFARSKCAVFIQDPKLVSLIDRSNPSVVITNDELAPQFDERFSLIITKSPSLYFVRLVEFLGVGKNVGPVGISGSAKLGANVSLGAKVSVGENAYIGENCVISDGVTIGAGAFIGSSCFVGNNTLLHPKVSVLDGTRIGCRTIVHPGAVLGGDGFGFILDSDMRWVKVPQLGGLVIGNDVEIGCNTTIDRGTLDDTIIGDGVKIDNQVQVGHNCRIDDHTIIAGCVGIAGSVKIGKRCKIGGAAMLTGHLAIADDVIISAGSLVSKTIALAGRYTGVYPLTSHSDWLSGAVKVRRLGQRKKISDKF